MNRLTKNLLFFVIGFGLACVVGIASASQIYWHVYSGGTPGDEAIYTTDPLAGCKHVFAYSYGTDHESYGYVHIKQLVDYGGGKISYRCSTLPHTPGDYGLASPAACPDGQAYNETTGQCEEDQGCPDAGTSAGNITVDTGWKTGPANSNAPYASGITNKYVGQKYNVDDCEVIPAGGYDCYTNDEPSANGYYYSYCTYDGQYTGNESSGSGSDPNPAPPADPTPPNDDPGGCPPGTTQTGMDSDGVPTCTGTGTPDSSNDSTSSENTQSNSDGSTTTTKTDTKNNADGSTTTTTTTTTTQPDGSTSSNVTKSTGSASNGTDGQEDSEGDDFCKLNPQLSICKESSWKGACGAFVCEGDAIQCAIAKEQHKRNCEIFKETTLSQSGQKIISGNDPLKETLPSPDNAEVVNVQSSLDDSGFGLNRSCLSDQSVTVMGRTLTFPFSSACQSLEGLKWIVMAIAGLASLKILQRPILGD